MEALHDFFFDRTSFSVKGFAQFHYSTAQGDSLFGGSIREIRVSRLLRKNELLQASHLIPWVTFFHMSGKLGFIVLVDATVESKGEKHEKLEGNGTGAISIWLEKRVRIFRQTEQYTSKSEKKGIPRRVLPFIRKPSTRMNRFIWILPGITENSSQRVSVPYIRCCFLGRR